MPATERPTISLVLDSLEVTPSNNSESPLTGGALPPVQLSESFQRFELVPVQVSVKADARDTIRPWPPASAARTHTRVLFRCIFSPVQCELLQSPRFSAAEMM